MSNTSLLGLTDAEVARRRKAGDGNDVRPREGRSYLQIAWQTALSPVNVVLFSVSIVLLVVGLPIDAAVTALPVLMNVVVSFGLEASAKWRLDRLRILSTPLARVIRDGEERAIHPQELVRGDLVVVARGDQVVLDGDVIDGEVELDEALLTGESEAVVHGPGDRLLSGSACLSGRAVMQVTKVGLESYANELTSRAREARSEWTPLQRDTGRLIAATGILLLLTAIPVAIASGWTDRSAPTAEVVQAAAVLVALVPQGLAIMITVTYAVGALRISRAGALVQRINAIESMSRVDVLVLDKTGTITAGRLELRELLPIGVEAAEARRLLGLVATASPAGDRVGEAIALAVGAPAGDGIVDRVPFSSGRRWSGVGLGGDRAVGIVLGAPEVVLDAAARGSAERSALDRWAAAGLRVLVLARAPGTLRGESGAPRLPARSEPVALLGFAEEIRPDAAETLRAFDAEAVAVKVVSGDNPTTVAAIAERVGLTGRLGPIAGPDLASFDDVALAARVEEGAVFGRVEPSLKARIVGALRARGRYTAMIGDGVNDILALKDANLGVVMESGSSASRAVADLVLLGDRFAVLPRAVAEGRRIVDGMINVACLLLARTFALLVIVLGAALAGLDFPFTPRNNAVLALVTVGLPSLALVAWANPVPAPAGIIRQTLRFAIPAGLAVAAAALPVYAYYLAETGDLDLARSAITTMTVYCGILLIPFLIPPTRHLARRGAPSPAGDWRPTALAVAMVVLYAVIGAMPIARTFFELEPLSIVEQIALGLLALAWALVLYVARSLRFVDRLLEAVGVRSA